jgi:hypothetical protein
MVKIFEMQQELNRIPNHQSRVVEFESFEDYLHNLDERSLPPKEFVEIGFKYINHKEQTVTFRYEHDLFGRGMWTEFTHFARVIDEVNS